MVTLRQLLEEKEARVHSDEATDEYTAADWDIKLETVFLTALRILVEKAAQGEDLSPPTEIHGIRIGPVTVLGSGRLGLLIGKVLALSGSEVLLLGRHKRSLELPRQLGLDAGLTMEFEDSSFEIVVEATGNKNGLDQALRLTKPLGTLVMKSTYAELADVDLTKVVVGELTVIGSRCGPFEPALRLLASREIDVAPLIEAEYALRDGVAAMAHAAQPGVRKVLLRP